MDSLKRTLHNPLVFLAILAGVEQLLEVGLLMTDMVLPEYQRPLAMGLSAALGIARAVRTGTAQQSSSNAALAKSAEPTQQPPGDAS